MPRGPKGEKRPADLIGNVAVPLLLSKLYGEQNFSRSLHRRFGSCFVLWLDRKFSNCFVYEIWIKLLHHRKSFCYFISV